MRQEPPALVSVVTPVLNAVKVIDRCLDSVRSQDYPTIEHIIIDGASTDGTLDILHRRAAQFAYLHSEPDSGAAEAFDKGLQAARGDVIAFLNADDWYEPDAVSKAVRALETAGADFTYGAIEVHNDVTVLGVLDPLPPTQWGDRCYYEMPVPHISMFFRREALERVGRFDVRFKQTSDHDQFVRLMKAGCTGVFIPGIIAHMQVGGRSDSFNSLCQSMAIALKHGAPLSGMRRYFGRRVLLYPVRKTAKLLLGERLCAHLLKRMGSRHAGM